MKGINENGEVVYDDISTPIHIYQIYVALDNGAYLLEIESEEEYKRLLELSQYIRYSDDFRFFKEIDIIGHMFTTRGNFPVIRSKEYVLTAAKEREEHYSKVQKAISAYKEEK